MTDHPGSIHVEIGGERVGSCPAEAVVSKGTGILVVPQGYVECEPRRELEEVVEAFESAELDDRGFVPPTCRTSFGVHTASVFLEFGTVIREFDAEGLSVLTTLRRGSGRPMMRRIVVRSSGEPVFMRFEPEDPPAFSGTLTVLARTIVRDAVESSLGSCEAMKLCDAVVEKDGEVVDRGTVELLPDGDYLIIRGTCGDDALRASLRLHAREVGRLLAPETRIAGTKGTLEAGSGFRLSVERGWETVSYVPPNYVQESTAKVLLKTAAEWFVSRYL